MSANTPSQFAALRTVAIARSMGATLPELYWPPRPVANGLKTCRGVIVGGAIAPKPPEMSPDAELIQAAVLEPRTAKPRPLLLRVAGVLWGWM